MLMYITLAPSLFFGHIPRSFEHMRMYVRARECIRFDVTGAYPLEYICKLCRAFRYAGDMTPVGSHFDVTGDFRFGPGPLSSAVLGEDGEDGFLATAARGCKAQEEISDRER